ncbi:unnamed protein product [Allacma fusca]|uniref:Sorbitol dehydrogenase n=1 Tax=Allacma fusca TaxID=39272 RepID=A0A8J2J7S3_9HEXA|nr:unnamed protein product [Allacma fusca]
MAPSLVNEDNLSAVLHKKGDLRLENRPVPEPGDDEVLIRMAVVGICGTDVSFWTKGKVGDFVVKEPMVLGHESSGTVIKVGQKVKHLQPGDRVAIEPGGQCLYCEHCKSGRYNLCRKMEFCTTTPSHGNLCRYYTHAADFCFKLPDHVSLEEGALCEPLSIGLQACRRAQVSLGHTVLVCGAGAMGIVNLIVARAMGASKILMTDISASRLEAAKELGADQVLLVEAGVEMSQYATEVATLLGGAPDISIECSGAESSIKLAILYPHLIST